jgi:LasA protease
MALVACAVIIGVMLACARAIQSDNQDYWSISGSGGETQPVAQGLSAAAPQAFHMPATRLPGAPILTPTPDNPHPLPPLRIGSDHYTIQAGDTLGQVAKRFGISLAQLVEANNIANPDLVSVGQGLTIPPPTPEGTGPDFKIIPNSELVYGPASANFDLEAFIKGQGGYLASYFEEVDGQSTSGAGIVQRVAQDYSVNPRLLLAVLEYQSHWVTSKSPAKITLDRPINPADTTREGLYRHLAWAANNLNRGFYLWEVNGASAWLLTDGRVVPAAPTINAGTAGVQNLFASLYDYQGWLAAVSEPGLLATYNALFGYPFDYAVEPLFPANLRQPTLQLPFEPGVVWSFTGGPHGGWDDGSAWAALDFAPPDDQLGCVQSDEWVVASADGPILRAGNGAVIQDPDADGYEQTGWVLLYMHVETRDRVQPGTFLHAGDHVGHPSCEGGVSTGTHVHLARRYNGEWIPADQSLPFVLDGWVSRGGGAEYDGFLEKNGKSIEAYAGQSPQNSIHR